MRGFRERYYLISNFKRCIRLLKISLLPGFEPEGKEFGQILLLQRFSDLFKNLVTLIYKELIKGPL